MRPTANAFTRATHRQAMRRLELADPPGPSSARDGALALVEAGAGIVPTVGRGCTVEGATVTCRTADGSPFSAASINVGAGGNRAAVAGSVGALPLTLAGAEGPDVLQGGPGPDRISGGEGDDVLVGGEGDDVLVGDAGNDQLQGDGGRDGFFGNGGDDALRAVDGIEGMIECGPGVDRVEADAVDEADTDCEMPGAARVLPEQSLDDAEAGDPTRGAMPPPTVALRGLPVRSRCFFPALPVSRARRRTCRRPARGSALLVEATRPVSVIVSIQRVLPGTRTGPLCLPRPLRATGRCRRYVRAALCHRHSPAAVTAVAVEGSYPSACCAAPSVLLKAQRKFSGWPTGLEPPAPALSPLS